MNSPLEKSVRVRCSVQRAFEAFTDHVDMWWPPSHRRWQNSQLRFEPEVGGRFLERSVSGEETVHGEVLAWQEPDSIRYTWVPGGGTGPTQVEIRFRRDGDATLVEVTHAEGRSQLGTQWPLRVKKFSSAWSEVLPALANYLEGE